MKQIPEEIEEIISYLSHQFAKSMYDPAQSQEDLYNDLVVLYLENLKTNKVAEPSDKNHWFVFLKSRLLDKYQRLGIRNQVLKKYQKDLT